MTYRTKKASKDLIDIVKEDSIIAVIVRTALGITKEESDIQKSFKDAKGIKFYDKESFVEAVYVRRREAKGQLLTKEYLRKHIGGFVNLLKNRKQKKQPPLAYNDLHVTDKEFFMIGKK